MDVGRKRLVAKDLSEFFKELLPNGEARLTCVISNFLSHHRDS